MALSCCPVQGFCLWSRGQTKWQAPWSLCHRCATAAETPGLSGCFRQPLSCHPLSQKAVRGDKYPCGGTVWITVKADTDRGQIGQSNERGFFLTSMSFFLILFLHLQTSDFLFCYFSNYLCPYLL